MRILAIIPARGGSKGIPKKNIRLMNGRPLIAYAIGNALASKYITDVYVSTDSTEIADVAASCGAKIVRRDDTLSSDMVTLDPVIYDGMLKAEADTGVEYDYVITMQPTSPLLTVETLDSGIAYAIEKDFDTVISSVNKPHLSWGGGQESGVYPLYAERKNRQELPPQYLETGAFVVARRSAVKPTTRIGARVSVYVMPERESIDIDSKDDWVLAESIMQRRKIILRADGYKKLGMGHIYNCISMAYSLIEHDVVIVMKADAEMGLRKVQETNLPYHVIADEAELFDFIAEYQPDIFVNDCLNTDAAYIRRLKEVVPRVVTIEDLGTGVDEADAVINALYDENAYGTATKPNVYSGYRYVCLRDEFQLARVNTFSPEVRTILVMFGGTDPLNLNSRLYEIAERMTAKDPSLTFRFVTGIGYDNEASGVVTQADRRIFVHSNAPNVSRYMAEADLAVTSQGRTIFELAVMGVPAVVLSQNKREKAHRFAQMENGFLNLGLGDTVDIEVVENTLDWLISTPAIRRDMYRLMTALDLKSGVKRCKKIILGDNDE